MTHPKGRKAASVRAQGLQERGTPYFWGRRKIPLLYFLFPYLVVGTAFEAILNFRGINPGIVELSMIIPPVAVGSLLLRSARKFRIELAEAQPVHYLNRWRNVKIIWYILLAVSGSLAIYSIAFGTQSLMVSGPLVLPESLGILYLIDAYTLILPLRFWSPQSIDFARMHVAAMLQRRDSEARYLRDALRWFGRSYSRLTGLRLQQLAFTGIVGLDHESNRNLGLRLQHALQSDDLEYGIQALSASINFAREAVVGNRRTLHDLLSELALYLQVFGGILTILVIILVVSGKLPLSFLP